MEKLHFEDVKIEFEPIVKLTCLNFHCVHNLFMTGDAFCNLKQLQIGSDGKCKAMLLKVEEEKQNVSE